VRFTNEELERAGFKPEIDPLSDAEFEMERKVRYCPRIVGSKEA